MGKGVATLARKKQSSTQSEGFSLGGHERKEVKEQEGRRGGKRKKGKEGGTREEACVEKAMGRTCHGGLGRKNRLGIFSNDPFVHLALIETMKPGNTFSHLI